MTTSIWDDKHEINKSPVAYVSKNAYELFDDSAFSYLLRTKGVDLTRKIRMDYDPNSFSSLVPVFYCD